MPKLLKMLVEYDAEKSAQLLEHFIKEENGEKNVYIRGPWSESDVENRNNRIYPHQYLKREMDKLNEKAHSGVWTGSCDHPITPDYNLADAAIRILNIEQDKKNEKQFLGEAMVIKNSEKGQTLDALCKLGLRPGMSTRALGETEQRDGKTYVGESLNMITVDAVSDPSYQKAFQNVFQEDVEYFIDPKSGYIKEATESMRLKEKLHSAPKTLLPETILSIYHTFLKEAFNSSKKIKLFERGNMVVVKKDVAGFKEGDLYEIASVPKNISTPYLIKRWGKKIEHTISHGNLMEHFSLFQFEPKKEVLAKLAEEKSKIISVTEHLLKEAEVSFSSVEYLGEKKCIVKTGKKDTFAQKKAIAKMKSKLKKLSSKAKIANKEVQKVEKELKKAKGTIKESYLNGEYVAEIMLSEGVVSDSVFKVYKAKLEHLKKKMEKYKSSKKIPRELVTEIKEITDYLNSPVFANQNTAATNESVIEDKAKVKPEVKAEIKAEVKSEAKSEAKIDDKAKQK